MPSTTEISSENKCDALCIGKDRRNLCMYAVSTCLQTSGIVQKFDNFYHLAFNSNQTLFLIAHWFLMLKGVIHVFCH